MYEELKDIIVERPKHGHPGTNPLPGPTTSLAQLYREGWWITEIFGSQAVLAHRLFSGKSKCPRFRIIYKTILSGPINKKATQIIKQVQNQQWKKYKQDMLTRHNNHYRITNEEEL